MPGRPAALCVARSGRLRRPRPEAQNLTDAVEGAFLDGPAFGLETVQKAIKALVRKLREDARAALQVSSEARLGEAESCDGIM